MLWQRLFHTLKLIVVIILFLLLIAPEWPAFGDQWYRIDAVVGQRHFDYLVWSLDAARTKIRAMLANGHTFLDKVARRQLVLDYLALIQQARELERQIDRIYVDPGIDDADVASRDLQLRLAETRNQIVRLQPLAEAIVQDQVSAILAEEGFASLGRVWPPVMMYMSPVPLILIISPRDRIERIHSVSLTHGLTTPAQEIIETEVLERVNLSALVVPIGGMAMYPAMITETSSVNWLADVVAHEWAHHWMAPYPISLNYLTDPQVRTINETVASIVGTEVGELVIERYYPEHVPPPRPVTPPLVEPDPTMPPPFDFRAEMRETRIEVNRLLAEGEIEAAEAYMEERRHFIVENGYGIRKLNQAYFAFYGAYADEPGATGDDPIGPMVRELRDRSPSLRAFLRNAAPIGSFADLEAALANH